MNQIVRSGNYILHALLILIAYASVGCEYEWKEPPPKTSESYVFGESKQPDVGNSLAISVPTLPLQPPDVKPTLVPGRDVSGQDVLPEKTRRLNLGELVESGVLTVSANGAISDLSLALDEREDTLSKSEGINPYRVVFEFSAEKTIKAVRVLSSYSDFSWAFEAQPGSRVVVDTVIDGQWSTVVWPEGIKTKRFIIEVLRKHRDNFVHLNEVEVYE